MSDPGALPDDTEALPGKKGIGWGLWLALLPAVLGLGFIAWSMARPPARIVISSGEPGDVYHSLSQELVVLLREAFPGFPEGRRVEFVNSTSRGTVENVSRIRQGTAQLAMAEEGIDVERASRQPGSTGRSGSRAANAAEVRTLIQLFSSPLKVVARQDILTPGAPGPLDTLSDLKRVTERRVALREPALKVFIGAEGSGTHKVSRIVLDHYAFALAGARPGSAPAPAELEIVGPDWGFDRAQQAIETNEIQVALLMTEYGTEAVRELAGQGRFLLLGVDRGDGVHRWHPFLDVVSIPPAAYPAAAKFPPREIKTLAVDELLVASSTLSDKDAYRIVEALFKRSHELRSIFPFMVPHTRDEQLAQQFYYPPHPGATAFYQGRYEPQGLMDFLQRYQTILIGLASVSGTCLALYHFIAGRWWSRPLLRRLEQATNRKHILAVDFEASRLFANKRIDKDTYDAVKEYVRVSLNEVESAE